MEQGEAFWKACKESWLPLKIGGEKSQLMSLWGFFPLWEALPWGGIPILIWRVGSSFSFFKSFDSEFSSDRWEEMQAKQSIKQWIYDLKENKNVMTSSHWTCIHLISRKRRIFDTWNLWTEQTCRKTYGKV